MLPYRYVTVLLLLSIILVGTSCGAIEGVVHYPLSGVTVMPGNTHIISDETDDPIIEVTEFDFSIPSFVSLFLHIFNIHDVPVWAAELIVIIIGIITTIIGIITSGYIIILYTRRKLSDNPDARHMLILAYLEEHPGAQQIDIIKATGFSRGSVSYNLRRLIRELKIYKTGDKLVRYYPAGTFPTEKDSKAWKLLVNENRKCIFQTILKNPGISQKQISDETQIPITTLRWHLDKLEKENLIRVEVCQHITRYSVNPYFFGQYMSLSGSEVIVDG